VHPVGGDTIHGIPMSTYKPWTGAWITPTPQPLAKQPRRNTTTCASPDWRLRVVDWLLGHYDATHAALMLLGFRDSKRVLTLECDAPLPNQQHTPLIQVVVLPKMPGCRCIYRMKAPAYNHYESGSSNDIEYVEQDYHTLAELLQDLIILLPQD
jgi:hypothetical protein